jgi:hypothetical protein
MLSLANIIRVGTSRWMEGPGHVTCVGIIAEGKLEEKFHLEDTYLD